MPDEKTQTPATEETICEICYTPDCGASLEVEQVGSDLGHQVQVSRHALKRLAEFAAQEISLSAEPTPSEVVLLKKAEEILKEIG